MEEDEMKDEMNGGQMEWNGQWKEWNGNKHGIVDQKLEWKWDGRMGYAARRNRPRLGGAGG